MQVKFSVLQLNVFIGLCAALILLPFLGLVHLFDWDEINFAECAREMLVTHDYFTVRINFQPFWEKPPLFIWMSAASMSLFGVNEFAARFPDALCGIVTLLVIFNIGRRLYDVGFGLIWALCYMASFLPQFYFKSGIIDPWFNFFIFSGVYFFVLFCSRDQVAKKGDRKVLLLSALMIGLAVLTKGPVALLIMGLCLMVYLLIKRFRGVILLGDFFLYGIIILLVGGLWFLLLYLSGNGAVINEFFAYQVRLFQTQDSGHGGPFYYHVLVLFFGCFPASVFALGSFKISRTDSPFQKMFKLWMVILFWVVLILFSIVSTKIIHYSSLCYFPLTFLSSLTVYRIWNGTLAWKRWMGFVMIFGGGLIALIFIGFPLAEVFKRRVIDSGIIHDVFAVENLKADVALSWWEWIPGPLLCGLIVYCLVMCRRKRFFRGILVLLAGNVLVIGLASVLFAPRIERYAQGAAIDFYKSLQNKDCYLETVAFKSYAQYFYSAKLPAKNTQSYSTAWLLDGPVDKDVYFVSKITQKDETLKDHPSLRVLYDKNGFVFYERKLVFN